MEPQKNGQILNRESWLKIFIVVIITLVVSWRILNFHSNFNFSDLRFTDLLSLTVSFFAIALSAAFYFKATESSNNFYDNSYKFTKDISEILGRIEAGFGERLRHLDEGYAGLIKKMPYGTSQSPDQTAEKIEKEEAAIKTKEQEKVEIIEELVRRAQLQESEKEEFIKSLRDKDEDIINLKREQHLLRRKLENSNKDTIGNNERRKRAIDFLRDLIEDGHHLKGIADSPDNNIRFEFRKLNDVLPEEFIEDLVHLGLLDLDLTLTSKGIRMIKSLSNEFKNPAV